MLFPLVSGRMVESTASPVTARVSVSSSSVQGNDDSLAGATSADGRFAAFWSEADNLVHGDTNGLEDVFVRDRLDHITTRVSVSSAGQGDGDSAYPALSSDGMIVAFQSWAGNFSPGGSVGQVYVRDRRTHTTTLASQSSSGASGDDLSFGVRVSSGGRFVAFSSDADNLVPGDTNGQTDVFVRDQMAGTTTLISASSTGGPADGSSAGVTLSPHGRYVAFNSWADNLVAGDANGVADVFVTDRRVGATTLVSVSSGGEQGNGDSFGPLFASGARFVAYQSEASNLVGNDTNGFADVFVSDRQRHTTSRVSVSSTGGQGNGTSGYFSISADGRLVAFDSDADDLVAADTNEARDVFTRDRWSHVTRRVSVSSALAQGNDFSALGGLSADGRFVLFASGATNLVHGDTNRVADVFVRGPLVR
jgi:hypothetical protein